MSSPADRSFKARSQIADLRQAGWSDIRIAERIGVNKGTVWRWRTGRQSPAKGGKGGTLTRAWKAEEKAGRLSIGPGGKVSLTRHFRRIWVDDREIILPLETTTTPSYSFPPEAPVIISATFSDWVLDTGESINDMRLTSNVQPGSSGVDEITSALYDAVEKWQNYPVVFARVSSVMLLRGQTR